MVCSGMCPESMCVKEELGNVWGKGNVGAWGKGVKLGSMSKKWGKGGGGVIKVVYWVWGWCKPWGMWGTAQCPMCNLWCMCVGKCVSQNKGNKATCKR